MIPTHSEMTKQPAKRRMTTYYVVEITHKEGDTTHGVYKTEEQAKNVVQAVRQNGSLATLWHGSISGWDEHAVMIKRLHSSRETWKGTNFKAKKVTLAQPKTEPKEQDGPKTSTNTNDSSDRNLEPASGGDGGGFDFGAEPEPEEKENKDSVFERMRAEAQQRRAEEADEIRARSGGGDAGRLKPSGGS